MSDSTLSRSGAGRRPLSAGLVAGLGVMVAVGYGVYAISSVRMRSRQQQRNAPGRFRMYGP